MVPSVRGGHDIYMYIYIDFILGQKIQFPAYALISYILVIYIDLGD